ncbi:diguanylate cyclase domain-containing protein [Allohahella sp. A8]|uniref:diguanylate cyclase domain-containing protein n=1 Tax=Allohahella sp. A8 TaxID=3141461 RepID=UPI003A807368
MSDKTLAKGKVLVVDDNPQLIKMLSAILRGFCSVSFATSGEEALQVAAKQQPQVILLDMQLPGMDGFETCKALKSSAATANAAVLFVTAHSEADFEVRALELGAVDFIAKPFNPAVVTARVKTHLLLAAQTEAMRELIERDSLTGIYNRRYFDKQLGGEFTRHRRQALPMAVIMLDIDHFKLYNDGYGHVAGDECLRQVADILSSGIRRPGEFVARYGGEEFCVVRAHTTQEEAAKTGVYLCERVRNAVIPHEFSPTGAYLTISVGVVSFVPRQGMALQDVLECADQALYQAKKSGRNTSCVNSFD